MKRQDAPPPGWYPDPAGGARLRYWEGTDWEDRFRAPPVAGHVHVPTPSTAGQPLAGVDDVMDLGRAVEAGRRQVSSRAPMTREESQELITEVRQAARQEAERAAQLLGDQARSTVVDMKSLVDEYKDVVIKWIKRIMIVAMVLFLVYVIANAYAQRSLLDWLGDRIDNLTDNTATFGNNQLVRLSWSALVA